MISQKMRDLVSKLDAHAYDAGYHCRYTGDNTAANVINARVDLIQAIAELEAKLRGAREQAIQDIIDDEAYNERRSSNVDS